MTPRVVGLDLSISGTGAAYESASGLAVETWKLPATLGDRRLMTISDRVNTITWDTKPDLFVIEGPVMRSQAASVSGMVHGAVRCALMAAGVPYVLMPPATLKKYATGKGNADKTAMALALYKRAGLEYADDNQVDAWLLRAAGLQHLGHPIVDLPAAQVEVLAKVEWPS